MNQLLLAQPESINVALANQIRALQASGEQVWQLQTGDPDFDTPAAISQAAIDAMQHGQTHYCASSGLLSLKQAIVTKLERENNIQAELEQIIVTHGAVHGLYVSLQAILNPDDEVILMSPYWMPYQTAVNLTGAKTVVVQTDKAQQFEPSIEQISQAITGKTKAIIINSPSNPTGKVFSQSLLKQMVALAEQHQLYLISDEVYEHLIYQGKHHSAQALAPNYDKIITLFSFSKSYAMTGWRLGYVVANQSIIKQINKLNQYVLTSISPFSQLAGVTALTDNQVQLERVQMSQAYAKRLAHIKKRCQNTWLEHAIIWPDAAFYLFIDIRDKGINSFELCQQLLAKHRCGFTPGVAFGKEAEGFIRMTFATDLTTIDKGLDILLALA